MILSFRSAFGGPKISWLRRYTAKKNIAFDNKLPEVDHDDFRVFRIGFATEDVKKGAEILMKIKEVEDLGKLLRHYLR